MRARAVRVRTAYTRDGALARAGMGIRLHCGARHARTGELNKIKILSNLRESSTPCVGRARPYAMYMHVCTKLLFLIYNISYWNCYRPERPKLRTFPFHRIIYTRIYIRQRRHRPRQTHHQSTHPLRLQEKLRRKPPNAIKNWKKKLAEECSIHPPY
jgi:hypothetical protein